MKNISKILIIVTTLLIALSAQAQQYSKITYVHSDPDGTPFAATDEEGNL